MTNEELTGPYDFGAPRLANPNGYNEVEPSRGGTQSQAQISATCTYNGLANIAKATVAPAYLGFGLPNANSAQYTNLFNNSYMTFVNNMWNQYTTHGCSWWTNRVNHWTNQIASNSYNPYQLNRKLAKINLAQQMHVACGCSGPVPQKLAEPINPPVGYHYMPNGLLMSDVEHAKLSGGDSAPLVRDPQKHPYTPLQRFHMWGRASCAMEHAYQWYINADPAVYPQSSGDWSKLIFTDPNGITHNIDLVFALVNKLLPGSMQYTTPDSSYAAHPGGPTQLSYKPWNNLHNNELFYQWAGSPSIGQVVAWRGDYTKDANNNYTGLSEESGNFYQGVPTPVTMVYLGKSTHAIPSNIPGLTGIFTPSSSNQGPGGSIYNWAPLELNYPTVHHIFASCGDALDAWKNGEFGEMDTDPSLKIAQPGDTTIKVTKRGNKKIDGWVLTQGGSYVTETTLQDTRGDGLEKVITEFNLNLTDLTATTETRPFKITGDDGAEFILEIKNEAGNYYNFHTQTFTSTRSVLDEKLEGGFYTNEVVFPASGSDDQYDIFLHAKAGTKHVSYVEKRFEDDSIDLNGCIGSNSLLLQKVIYQYNSKLTLTLSGYSIGGVISGVFGTATIDIDRYKEQETTAFSFTTTATTTTAFRVLKQPLEEDVLSFIEPTLGSSPVILPGENEYPYITETAQVQSGGISSSATIILRTPVPDIKVGDKWTSDGVMPTATQYVQSVTTDGDGNVTQFVTNTAASHSAHANLTFYARVNYSWPVNNYVNLIKDGMIVVPGTTGVPTGTTVKAYSDKTTTSVGTKKEQILVSKTMPAVSTKNLKPTVVKGLVTTQAGDITFSNQLPIALASTAIKIGGYGESEALRLYGWDVEFSNLAITLTPPTTTTREASAGGSSADIDVNSREGVINNVSRVSGIGINPALQNPLITAGGGATGTGDWTMDAVQTLENGATLTIENTSRVATITGNIRINKAGNASQNLRFDIGKLLSTSAP